MTRKKEKKERREKKRKKASNNKTMTEATYKRKHLIWDSLSTGVPDHHCGKHSCNQT